MDFKELLDTACITRMECRQLFNVTDRTYKNWVRYGAPSHVVERLSLFAGTHSDWKGTQICAGYIITSNGTKLSKNQLDLLTYVNQVNHRLIEILQARLSEFENDQSMISKTPDHDADKARQKTPDNCTSLDVDQRTLM